MTALKTLIFTVLVPGVLGFYLPFRLGSESEGTMPLGDWRYVGWIPIAIGAAIYFWCAWDFTFTGKGTPAPIDPPKTLVVRGPYKYVRNPMYIGVLTLVLGQAMLLESRLLVAYAAFVFLAFFAFVILYEEPTLKRKFNGSYEEYRRTVPRWIPWPGAMWREGK